MLRMRYPAAAFKAKVETLRLPLCVENLKHAHGACLCSLFPFRKTLQSSLNLGKKSVVLRIIRIMGIFMEKLFLTFIKRWAAEKKFRKIG
jgi:hypothetical protein